MVGVKVRTVSERLTDAVLDIADTYDDVGFARGIAENVLEELLPEVSDIDFLMALPFWSLLLGKDGTGWTRMPNPAQPWVSPSRGGYGASGGDLREITQRFAGNEGPLRLVWVP